MKLKLAKRHFRHPGRAIAIVFQGVHENIAIVEGLRLVLLYTCFPGEILKKIGGEIDLKNKHQFNANARTATRRDAARPSLIPARSRKLYAEPLVQPTDLKELATPYKERLRSSLQRHLFVDRDLKKVGCRRDESFLISTLLLLAQVREPRQI